MVPGDRVLQQPGDEGALAAEAFAQVLGRPQRTRGRVRLVAVRHAALDVGVDPACGADVALEPGAALAEVVPQPGEPRQLAHGRRRELGRTLADGTQMVVQAVRGAVRTGCRGVRPGWIGIEVGGHGETLAAEWAQPSAWMAQILSQSTRGGQTCYRPYPDFLRTLLSTPCRSRADAGPIP